MTPARRHRCGCRSPGRPRVLYAVALRRLRRLLRLPAGLPQDRLRADPGRRGQPDGRLRPARGAHAPGRRLAVRPVRTASRCSPARFAVVAVGAAVAGRARPPLTPLGTIAFLAMAAALGAGSGATFALVAQRRTRPTRSARHRRRRRRRRPRRLRPAAADGLVYGRTGSLRARPAAAGRSVALRRRGRRLAGAVRRRAVATYGGREDAASDALRRHDAQRDPTAAPGWTGDARPDALVRHPPVLHPGGGLGRPADAAPDRRPRGRRLLPGPLEPRQGGPLHPRRELHRLLLVEGLRQGRHHHLGVAADRLPVGRARTGPSTSPAAAPAAPRSPGTPTRRPGSATPTSAACCWRCTARPRPGSATRCAAWADDRRRPRAGRGATSRPAARAAWCGPPGTRPPRSSPPPTCTPSSSTGPDRVAGFSPIPAMSMVSHAVGRPVRRPDRRRRCCRSTTGTPTCRSPRRRCSATRPTCPSPGDWWDAGYLIMWGSNVPVTRTPDAHWMAEARYRGQKVVAVSPDYADNVKFADEWLPRQPGTDGALAMAMGHVILKEFFVDRQTPYFVDYVKQLHRPAVPGRASTQRRRRRVTGRASSSPPPTSPATRPQRERRVQDRAARRRAPASRWCPTARWATGSATTAWAGGTSTSATSTRQLLDAGDRRRHRSRSTCRGSTTPTAPAASMRRGRAGPPGRRPPGHHRLRPAARAVRRRPRRACPALAHRRTTTPTSRTRPPGRRRSPACRPRRRPGSAASSRANAEESGGRSMIIMGAGTNHWFHSDTIYRAFLDPDHAHRLPGRQRRRLGALRRAGEGAARSPATPSSRSRWTGAGRRGR